MIPVQGSSEARLRKRRKGAAGQGECSSYAGMNRVKFAGLNLSTGVHPGAEAMLTRNGVGARYFCKGVPDVLRRRSKSATAWSTSSTSGSGPKIMPPIAS